MSAKRPQHRDYDETKCPVVGCKVTGTVPGIKRHVKLSTLPYHGKTAFNKLTKQGAFPPIRKADVKFNEKTTAELKKLAEKRGIDPNGKRRSELVGALAE